MEAMFDLPRCCTKWRPTYVYTRSFNCYRLYNKLYFKLLNEYVNVFDFIDFY